jgi:broad specificity phosphatase PhoE
MLTKKSKPRCISPFKSLLLFFILSSCATTNYYLVRHAEKADNSRDPDLSEAGHLRAIALKDSLLSKSIEKIYVTNLKRTQQTATPCSEKLGISPSIIQATSTDALIDSLYYLKGKNVLVVGHSNTVPVIIDNLMKQAQHISIAENDFDNFFKVSIKRGLRTKRKLIKTTYGSPSP